MFEDIAFFWLNGDWTLLTVYHTGDVYLVAKPAIYHTGDIYLTAGPPTGGQILFGGKHISTILTVIRENTRILSEKPIPSTDNEMRKDVCGVGEKIRVTGYTDSLSTLSTIESLLDGGTYNLTLPAQDDPVFIAMLSDYKFNIDKQNPLHTFILTFYEVDNPNE